MNMMQLLLPYTSPFTTRRFVWIKPKVYRKIFCKKDKKGSLWILDSINCPSLIVGNGHVPFSYLSNIMSPCLILKAKNVSYHGQHSIIEFFHMQHSGKAICVFTPVSISILIFLLVYTL